MCRVCTELRNAQEARDQAANDIRAEYDRAVAAAVAKYTRDSEDADEEKAQAEAAALRVDRPVRSSEIPTNVQTTILTL